MTTLSFHCQCKLLQGIIKNFNLKQSVHLVCMCDDCQHYASYLKQEKILTESKGTEIVQLTISQVEIITGKELLACLRLSSKGLLRWYASCCNTPIANTLPSKKIPFVGFQVCTIPIMERKALGPILAHVQAKFGKEPFPPKSYKRAPLFLIWRSLKLLIFSFLLRKKNHFPFPSLRAKIL